MKITTAPTEECKKCSSLPIWAAIGRVGFCQDLNCPVHGQAVADRKFAKVKRRLDSSEKPLGHKSWIIHITDATTRDELVALKQAVMKIFKGFHKYCLTHFVLHDSPGCRHFNVALASVRITGLIDELVALGLVDKNQPKIGRPCLHDTTWLIDQMNKITLPCVRSIEQTHAMYQDNHLGWLKYCLRAEDLKEHLKAGEKIKGCTGHAFRVQKYNYGNAGNKIRGKWTPDHISESITLGGTADPPRDSTTREKGDADS